MSGQSMELTTEFKFHYKRNESHETANESVLILECYDVIA